MAIKARYTNIEHTAISVILDEGDTLGNMSGPIEFSVGMSPGNREFDDLESKVANDNLYVADYQPPEAQAPTIISDRQFFTQLALDGVITEDEAIATSDGTMPALLNAILDQIPNATERFKARMLVKNATTFERHQALVAVVAQALGWSDDDLDDLWLNASLL